MEPGSVIVLCLVSALIASVITYCFRADSSDELKSAQERITSLEQQRDELQAETVQQHDLIVQVKNAAAQDHAELTQSQSEVHRLLAKYEPPKGVKALKSGK
jgi:peptidoglycan hydrolase CwlO-like protein